MRKIYVCGDYITGIYSAIYDAWMERNDGREKKITFRGHIEQELFCEYAEVKETEHKAIAVERLIRENLGAEAYWDIYHALMSTDREKGTAVLNTMLTARTIKHSKRIMSYLSNPYVQKVFELSRSVSNEAHYFIEFVRFRELENGVMFSEITPKEHVLTCIANHFTDRFPLENWMIYDKTHHSFLLHEVKKRWILVLNEQVNEEQVKHVSEGQKKYERLWKSFWHTISIEVRENRALQNNNLPIHFQQDMVEFERL